MKTNERLQLIVNERFDGNKKRFAERAGLAYSTVSSMLTNRNVNPSSDNLERIILNVVGLNADWLITGRGKPYSVTSNAISNATSVPVDMDRLDLILELSKAMKQNNEMLSESLVEAKNEIADLKKQLAQKDKDAEQIRTDYRAILKEKDKTIAEMGEELLKYSDSTTTGE